jgi:hypothetical protein
MQVLEGKERLRLEDDAWSDFVDRLPERRRGVFHRVEEEAVGVGLSKELGAGFMLGRGLAPRPGVPRVVVEESPDTTVVKQVDERANAGQPTRFGEACQRMTASSCPKRRTNSSR